MCIKAAQNTLNVIYQRNYIQQYLTNQLKWFYRHQSNVLQVLIKFHFMIYNVDKLLLLAKKCLQQVYTRIDEFMM